MKKANIFLMLILLHILLSCFLKNDPEKTGETLLPGKVYLLPEGSGVDPKDGVEYESIRDAVQQAQAGDTIYLSGGIFSENNLLNIDEGNSGTEGNPITIRNIPGETPVIDGGFTSPPADINSDDLPVFNIQGKHYIVLDGLTIQHGWRANVAISDDEQSTHITIQNCDMRDFVAYSNCGHIYLDNGEGDQNGADEILIYNNMLHDYINGGDIRHTCGLFSSFSRTVTISDNEIYNISDGIYFKHTSWTGCQQIIQNNYIHDIRFNGIKHNGSDAIITNNSIQNVHNPEDSGIAIVFCESYQPISFPAMNNLVIDNQIIHNTIIDCDQGIKLGWGSETVNEDYADGGVQDTIIRDNLIYNFTCKEFRGIGVWVYSTSGDSSRTTIDHNLVYTPLTDFDLNNFPVVVVDKNYSVTSLPSSIIDGTGNIQEAPVFVNVAENVFSLADGSPGKNAASDDMDMGVIY